MSERSDTSSDGKDLKRKRLASPSPQPANETKRRKTPTHAAASPAPQSIAGHPYGCSACDVVCDTLAGLKEHFKSDVHAGQEIERPWQCRLCQRTYKNPNGLQYHIQVSIINGVHVESSKTRGRPSKAPSASVETAVAPMPLVVDEMPGHLHALATAAAEAASVLVPPERAAALEESRESFWCPLSGCWKQYKQLSGLRYHLARGHSPAPTLLEIEQLSPGLASRLNGRGEAYSKMQQHGGPSEAEEEAIEV